MVKYKAMGRRTGKIDHKKVCSCGEQEGEAGNMMLKVSCWEFASSHYISDGAVKCSNNTILWMFPDMNLLAYSISLMCT